MKKIKPGIFEAKLAEKYFLSENQKFMYFKFELMSPHKIEFRAGQYVSLKVNDKGERRSYSIASTPDMKHAIELVVDVSPNGLGTNFLKKLPLGKRVEILGPLGRFVVLEDVSEKDQDQLKGERKFLFVGTGSGVVPLRSMILDLLRNRKETRPIRLHWGLRYEEDVFWLDNFQRLMEEFPNFVLDLVLSKPNNGWQLCWGHIQDCLKRDVFSHEDMGEWEAYVCGNQKMVEDIRELLEKKGVDKERIYFERFN